MARRRTLAAALGLAVAAAAILALWIDRGAVGEPAADPLAREDRASDAPPVARPDVPALATRPGADSSSRPSEARSDDPADEWPSIPVVVQEADGSLRSGATVYALPAGTAGADDGPPQAETGDDGRARLRVVRAGSYDVGAVADGRAAPLAEGVAIPSRTAVRLVLPALGRVTVHLDPDVPIGERGWSLSYMAPWDETTRRFPGRGERAAWHPPVHATSTREWTGDLPTDRDFLAEPYAPPWSIEPRRFRAPAELWLRLSHPYPVRFVPEVARDAARPPFDAQFDVSIESSGMVPSPARMGWSTRADEWAGAEPPPNPPHAFLAAPRATVRWSGPGIEPGSLELSGLERGVEREVRIPIRIREFVPLQVLWGETLPERPVRVLLPAGSPVPWRVFLYHGTFRDSWEWDPDGDESEPPWTESDEPGWVQAVGVSADEAPRSLVAGPVWVAPLGEIRLTLREGGFLVVVPRRLPPPSIGSVTIERSDGAPFPSRQGAVDLGVEQAVTLEAGLAIGPLEPGTVSFRVRVAGIECAEATAVVRAGEHVALEVPPLTPR